MSNERPVQSTDPGWRPKRVLLALAVTAQLLVLGVALWYSETLPPAPTTPPVLVKEVLVPEDLVFVDSETAPRTGKQLPPVDVEKAAAGTPDQIKNGGQLFAQHCTSCHGQGGRGDGAAAAGMNPKPRDLTALRDWKGGTRLSDVFRTVSNGLQGTAMPAFDYLSHEQRFALGHFVLKLASGHALDDQESLAKLDSQFSLASGAKEPNVVPLSKAIDRLVAEDAAFRGPAAGLLAASGAKPGETVVAGSELLRRVLDQRDATAAFNVLKNDRSWRSNSDRLRRIVSANAGANGFLPRAIQLNTVEWEQLRAFLLSALPEAVAGPVEPASATAKKPGI